MASRELSDTEKSHFNDPTFSDLSIILSDRVITVHCVILCRESDYFRKLLSGRFKENGAKEIELHDDDPEAMMAMFRFMYGLPYAEDQAEWHDWKSILPHVKAYVVADKYQVTKLKKAVMFNIQSISCTPDERDIVPTLRAIFDGMPENEGPRPLMIDYCVHFLARLRKRRTS